MPSGHSHGQSSVPPVSTQSSSGPSTALELTTRNLQGGTVVDWALNVFDEEQAAAEVPTLRAIASAEIHNLVFQRDNRIIPAMLSGRIS
jgi:hypothetical protein